MSVKALVKDLELGIDTMKINAKKSKTSVKYVENCSQREFGGRESSKEGKLISLKKYRVKKAVLGEPKRGLLLQVHSSGQEHNQERDSNA